jgi:hypothetical protein
MSIKGKLRRGFVAPVFLGLLGVSAATATLAAQAPSPGGQGSPANPELVGRLAERLGVDAAQAQRAAGSIFGIARERLPQADWSRLAAAVPGMDGLLAAAPATGTAARTGLSSSATAALGGAGSALTAATSAFQQLGLNPSMVAPALDTIGQYVTGTGGAEVAQLLTGLFG